VSCSLEALDKVPASEGKKGKQIVGAGVVIESDYSDVIVQFAHVDVA